MTDDTEKHGSDGKERPASLPLLADAPELMKVRVRPAEFARIVGVSRQTISRWVSGGKITVHPLDGRIDMQAAVRQVLQFTEPGKLRARLFRQAVADVNDLRAAVASADARAAALDAELSKARSEAQYFRRYSEDCDRYLDAFKRIVIAREADLRRAPDSSAWRSVVDEIELQAAGVCDRVEVDPDLEELAMLEREAKALWDEIGPDLTE
jgi:transcriptional regulator with XRE-family HTH domain